MSNELKYIDNLFKDSLSNYKVVSTESNILKANKIIGKFNFFHFSFNTFNIYYISLIIISILFFYLYYGFGDTSNKIYLKASDFKRQTISIKDIVTPVDSLNFEDYIKITETIKTHYRTKDKTENKNEIEDIILTQELDSVIIEDKINSIQDTIVTYKRIIIADTVRTIIHKKVRPRKKRKKD